MNRKHKPKLSGKTEGQGPSVNAETTNMKLKDASSTRQMKAKPSEKTEGQDPSVKTEVNPSLNSETSDTTLKVHTSNSSRGYNASKAPSFRNVTRHGHKLPKQAPPIMTALEKQGECDVQSESVHELHIQAPQVVLSANDQDPHEAQSEEDGNESVEGHVPLELFAEFLQAVMTRNYKLAKKLCQMSFLQKNNSLDEKSRMVGAFKESAKNQMSCDNSERFTRAETDFSNLFARDLLPAKNGEEPTIQFLLEVVEILTNYVRKTFDRSTKVLDFHHPHQLLEGMEGFNLELSDQPESLEQILVDCRDTLKYGVRTGMKANGKS
ncbi:hypothetical protein cypCar_00008857 [Cyprinus carpio]|nr:hypothetical protein cypCar_00008857 [Cyprinus carpio]